MEYWSRLCSTTLSPPDRQQQRHHEKADDDDDDNGDYDRMDDEEYDEEMHKDEVTKKRRVVNKSKAKANKMTGKKAVSDRSNNESNQISLRKQEQEEEQAGGAEELEEYESEVESEGESRKKNSKLTGAEKTIRRKRQSPHHVSSNGNVRTRAHRANSTETFEQHFHNIYAPQVQTLSGIKSAKLRRSAYSIVDKKVLDMYNAVINQLKAGGALQDVPTSDQKQILHIHTPFLSKYTRLKDSEKRRALLVQNMECVDLLNNIVKNTVFEDADDHDDEGDDEDEEYEQNWAYLSPR